jgi:hypothetical protein
MITPTNYTIDRGLLRQAASSLTADGMKTPINRPMGNFFYDPWELKEEYKETIWEQIYNSLPVVKGEARIIVLNSGQAYTSHADIDDRYHLNISGEKCYLIDLAQRQMHKLEQDGIWYDMNAGLHHTAANFGIEPRVQLVIRKPLEKHSIEDSITVTIKTKLVDLDEARYMFDNHISPWLNLANKKGYINNFQHTPSQVKFELVPHQLDHLKDYMSEDFLLEL